MSIATSVGPRSQRADLLILPISIPRAVPVQISTATSDAQGSIKQNVKKKTE